MTIPRVVITGLGVVSPNGIGKEAFCRAILAGKSGVKRISRFDPSELPVHIAGEIPEFDELAWVDARERKHVSRVVPLAIAASHEAIADAGVDPANMSMDEKREIGVILGTGGGAQEFSEEQYKLWHTGHIKQVSLFCIPSAPSGRCPAKSACASVSAATVRGDQRGVLRRPMQWAMPTSIFKPGFSRCSLVGGVDATITPGMTGATVCCAR